MILQFVVMLESVDPRSRVYYIDGMSMAAELALWLSKNGAKHTRVERDGVHAQYRVTEWLN